MKCFDIIKKHNISPKYCKGQNFLIDQNISRKIIESADIRSNSNILEIGPGIGSITKYIIRNNIKTLTLIELDKQFASILDSYSEYADILYADILKIDFTKILPQQENNIIISNLPYYISSKIIMKILKMPKLPRLLLMLQKELADRILSPNNKKSYGRLSVMTQNLYKIEKICDVKPTSFYPQPSVTSSVLKFDPLNHITNPKVIEKLFIVLKYSFASRRKLLIKNLQNLDSNIHKIFQKNALNSLVRAENLTTYDYLKLSYDIEIERGSI